MKSRASKGLAVILLLSGLALSWLWLDYQRFLKTPLPLAEDDTIFHVMPGTGMQALARQLQQQGLLAHPGYLSWYARLTNQAHRLQAGEYALRLGMTPIDLLDLLVTGKVVQHSFTIVEGWNIWQLLEAVAANEVLTHTLDYSQPEHLMDQLGHPGEHPEGRFYPDTYHFPRGTRDAEFLNRAYAKMQEVLASQWPERAVGLPLTSPYEALILASIVEKETAVPDERGMIAGVFVRRLQKRMYLQTDPTVIYGLGPGFDGNLRRRDLKQDNPYNSYMRKGLPPTPIALPGAAAIAAVLHPAEGDELYFVARGDGSHQFSSSLEAHNQAVIKYQLGGRKNQRFSSSQNEIK